MAATTAIVHSLSHRPTRNTVVVVVVGLQISLKCPSGDFHY